MSALRHDIAGVFHDTRRLRVGIFGGSFNPAHGGHAHIADCALRVLGLDEVLWLVSPQNPLKDKNDMGDFSTRFESALQIAGSCRYAKRMRVSAFEKNCGTYCTAETLPILRACMPRMTLFWIMGADGLADFHEWHDPAAIAATMPIAVVARPSYQSRALKGRGARIAGRRIPSPRRFAAIASPNTWCFIHARLRDESATAIRKKRAR